MVGVAGFEPTTPCPPDKCANRAALHSDCAGYREAYCAMQQLYDATSRFKLVSRALQDAFAFIEVRQRLLQRTQVDCCQERGGLHRTAHE